MTTEGVPPWPESFGPKEILADLKAKNEARTNQGRRYSNFEDFLADGPRRAPNLYGKPGEAPRPAEVPPTLPAAPPPAPKAAPPPEPADRKSLAAGDDWDAAEIVEDAKEEETP